MSQLPLPAINMNEVNEGIDKMIATIGHDLTAQRSRAWLETALRESLLRGSIEMLPVIEDAEQGDEIADAVLRQIYFDMRDAGREPPKTLEVYCLRVHVLKRGPAMRAAGRVWYDNWRRDIGIAVLVFMALVQFGRFNLRPTRNREQRRRQQPSMCSLVTAGIGRGGINISEKRVENIWARLQGQIGAYLAAQGRVAESPSIPSI
jgi:hypothetical protein